MTSPHPRPNPANKKPVDRLPRASGRHTAIRSGGSGSSGTRIAFLDGIRAIAITGVLIEHWWAHRLPYGLGGYLGVDLFFVLSGYIITTMLWRSGYQGSLGSQWLSFILKRARRLYPALAGLLIGAVIIYALVPTAPLSTSQVAGHAIVAGLQLYPAWFSAPRAPFLQTWSLAIEWYFYLVWPVALLACRNRGVSARTMMKGVTVVAATMYLASLALPADMFYATPPLRFAELLAGGALAFAFISTGDPRSMAPASWARAVLGPLAVGAIAVYVMLGPGVYGAGYRFVGVPLAVSSTCYLISAGAAGSTDAAIRLLSWRPIAFLGRISYSLYLWHLMITGLVTKDNLRLPGVARGAFEIGATFGLTLLSYVFLERPFTRSRSRVLMPDSPPPEPFERDALHAQSER
jgi:peptidoglycan/LPS O-acetylase OafA/YrhL